MDTSTIIALINNVALLLMLGILYNIFRKKQQGGKHFIHQAITGIILGSIGIAVMLTPWHFGSGVVFDTRSVLLSVSGLFFGTLPTLVAILMTGAFRIYNGGSGMWTGVAVIISSGAIGVAWRYLRHRKLENISISELYGMGLAVHIVMLLWMFLMPLPLALSVLSQISLPVIAIYPVSTVLLGQLLVNHGAHLRMEQELRESEEKHRALYENAPLPYQSLDEDGCFLDINPAWLKVLGYDREEVIGKWFGDFLHPDWELHFKKNFSDFKRRGYVNNVQFKIRHSDGHYIEVSFECGLGYTPTGKFKQTYCVFRDITEQMRAEMSLRESQRQLSVLMNNLPGMAYQCRNDQHWTMMFVSDGCEVLTGYKPEELVDNAVLSFVEVVHSEDRQMIIDTIQDAYENKQSFQLVHRITTANGDEKWVWEQGQFVFREKSEAPFLEGFITDITERLVAEEQLKHYAHLQQRLVGFGRALGSTMDTYMICRTTHLFVCEFLDVSNFSITLFEPDKKLLQPVFAANESEILDIKQLPPIPYTPEDPQAHQSKVITSQHPIITHKLMRKAPENEGLLIDETNQVRRPIIYVPMIAEGKTIGVMDIQSRQENQLTEKDSEWLSVAANQAALALQNIHLYEQIRKRVSQLTGLRDIDTAINAHRPLIDTIHTIFNQIIHQLELDAGIVWLLDAKKEQLTYLSSFGFKHARIETGDIAPKEGFARKIVKNKKIIRIYNTQGNVPVCDYFDFCKKEGFQSYLGFPLIVNKEVKGVLVIFHRSPLSIDLESEQYLDMLAGQTAIAIDNTQLLDGLKQTNISLTRAYDATIEGWAHALELRDMETEGHSRRVVEMTMQLTQILGFPDEKLTHIRRGALLHDIGKMGVPDAILQKPGKLNDEEWHVMRQHPVYAYEWLSLIEYLQPALDIPYCHHEKWDGSGYPRGLQGEQIPLSARIFAVIDVWDALSSDRPYRKAWPKDKTLAYIQEQSGKHFDPQVVDAFIAYLDENDGNY